MSDDLKHMDDAFKKASEQLKATYDKAFWEEAKAKLEDASLDQAFRAAANLASGSSAFVPTESVDDVFMDAAFVDASTDVSVNYDASFFEDFKENEQQYEMDAAFQEAAAAVTVDYIPEYWSDADQALQNEGLHYEYQSAYWEEAKKLLDKSDRKSFFIRWSGAAAVLMLFSLMAPLSLTEDRGLAGIVENGGNADWSNANRFEQFDQVVSTNLNESGTIFNENGGASSLTLTNEGLSDIQTSSAHTGDINTDELVSTTTTSATSTTSTASTTASNNSNVFTNRVEPMLSTDDVTLSPLAFEQVNELFGNQNNRLADIDRIDLKTIENTPLAPQLELDPNNRKPRGAHSIALLASGGVGNRWASPQLVPTLRSSFGAEYLYSPAWGIKNIEFGASAMINHTRQNGLGVEKRTSVYDINGGVTKYWYKLQISDIITTNVNFITNYRIAPRHKFRLGCGIEWLTAVKSNMSYQSAHYGDIQTVNNNWGVKDGLNAFDFRVSAGYDFQLTNSLTIQLSGNVGFLDRTNNDFLKSNIYDREMNVMLGLKYNIFRKI